MEDIVIVDGHARGIIAKNLITGKLERFSANAVVIATGGYGNAYFLSRNNDELELAKPLYPSPVSPSSSESTDGS